MEGLMQQDVRSKRERVDPKSYKPAPEVREGSRRASGSTIKPVMQRLACSEEWK